MSADRCPRCDQGDLVQFQAQRVVPADRLPQVCRSCSAIVVDGRLLKLPEAFEAQALEMVDASAQAATAARRELEGDPEQRIEEYMANYYRAAYLDGFVRALAWWTHHGKEGRLKRIRELWNASVDDNCWRVESHPGRGRLMTPEAYTEIEQLLNLSPGEPHGQSTKNEHPTIPKSPA